MNIVVKGGSKLVLSLRKHIAKRYLDDVINDLGDSAVIEATGKFGGQLIDEKEKDIL